MKKASNKIEKQLRYVQEIGLGMIESGEDRSLLSIDRSFYLTFLFISHD